MSAVALVLVIVVLAGAVLATLLLAVARKGARAVGTRRRARRERAVQPLLVRTLAGEPVRRPRRAAQVRVLEDLAVDALRTVRGESHDAVVAMLAFPYLLVFEVLGPVIELLGFATLLLGLVQALRRTEGGWGVMTRAGFDTVASPARGRVNRPSP